MTPCRSSPHAGGRSRQGIDRATKALCDVKSAWVKEMRVSVEDGKVSEYQVNMQVTFVLGNRPRRRGKEEADAPRRGTGHRARSVAAASPSSTSVEPPRITLFRRLMLADPHRAG